MASLKLWRLRGPRNPGGSFKGLHETVTTKKSATEAFRQPLSSVNSAAGRCGRAPQITAAPQLMWDQRRVQVCVLHRTFMTQPFIFSELPLTVPEPL